MMQTLGRIVILVNDYDEAANFYRDKLGLDTLFDAGEGARRFLHLGFGQGGVWLLLADSAEARTRVGNQTGGQPVGVVYTDDIHGDFARLAGKGVKVAETVQSDAGSFHFRFHDLYGNQWVLVQLDASAR
ncbi:VOC family protein [Methylosinus sp. C49]|uniref:VOC family protein n=1 Tax=Methylosinus sp. C49 TaxID=2699395 RepID=UPI0018D95D63|nr:VOC family protein [Methylosinus sp. C49]